LNCFATIEAPSNSILTLTGDFVNSGIFNHNSGTVKLTGSAQSIGGTTPTTFYNLALGGSGTKSFLITASIAGNLSIDSGVIADLGTFTTHSANYLIIGGTLQSATGTWGSTLSGATNINDTYFSSNTGLLNVANGGTTYYSRMTGN